MTGSVHYSRLGDYELLAKLGEGGMGAVYKARQVSLDRIVAIKVLPRRLAADKNYLERFLREARATARLNHPNIVAGIDVTFSDGYYYFVMEYLEAVTLRALIKEKQTLSERSVLRLGALIARALAHAHKANIIHRDVKPENILIDSNGVPKLTDLGLSKVTETEGQDGYLTQAGLVVGTAYYIAPEQASGDANVDGRADIYSLGCTLYHATTGQPPHEAPTPAVLMVKHISEKMPHPQSINPKISDEFCDVLARMVARKPADRYGSAEQAAKDMEQLLAGTAPSREPLAPEVVNFLPIPNLKSSNPDVKPAARSSIKKTEPPAKRSLASTAPARPGRTAGMRQRSQHSWTYIAVIATVAILLLALLLMNYSSSPAASNAATDTHTETANKIAENISKKPEPPPPIMQAPPKLPEAVTEPKKAAEPPPRPRQAPPPLNLNYTSEPAFELSAMTSILSDPATDSNWALRAPKWEYVNGTLRGMGVDGNASLFRRRVFTRNFELFMSVETDGFFHFGWQGYDTPGNFIQHELDGTVLISKFDHDQSTVFTSFPKAAPPGRHDYRVIVQDTKITLYIDGHLAGSTNEGAVGNMEVRRDLQIYAAGRCRVTYHKILFRDLPSK